MNRKVLKIFIVLVVMWFVSILTILREFRLRSSTHVFIIDKDQFYEQALKHYRRKSNKGNTSIMESKFDVWRRLEPADHSFTMEDKLAAIEGYDLPPGMDGRPVFMVRNDNLRIVVRMAARKGWEDHAFNQFVSDLIPVTRTLPDHRDEWCKEKNYTTVLPQASVIICFHNEAWSTLMRTVYSVLNRSPEPLLKEVILIDDYSTMPHLKQRLSEHTRALAKVKLVRADRREGLIRARAIGLQHVTAPVVVFLDSHCECAIGWLEPLLERISEDPTVVVSPVVDHIHDETFEYIPQNIYDLRIGGFNWNLRFVWESIPRKTLNERKHYAAPIKTPTISGGLFAIDIEFFKKLGFYDKEFDIWGAENLELSFKAWMCGGSMEIVPCSHVGHVFRKTFPYAGQKGSFLRNSLRLAKVWLDDYAKYFYERIGKKKFLDFGNVTERIKLRKKLNCKSFEWFLNNVYPDLEIPNNLVASGQIISTYCEMCLDASVTARRPQEFVKLLPCHSQGGNQFWVYTWKGEFKRDEKCLDYVRNTLTLFLCHGAQSQVWVYDSTTQTLRNLKSQKCLSIVNTDQGYGLLMENCAKRKPAQKWYLENYKIERLSSQLRNYLRNNIVFI